MKHLFIPYDIALKFKQLGYSDLCLAFYYEDLEDEPFRKQFELCPPINHNSQNHGHGYISSPLYQQAIDWIFKMSEGDIVATYDPSNNIEAINTELSYALNKL